MPLFLPDMVQFKSIGRHQLDSVTIEYTDEDIPHRYKATLECTEQDKVKSTFNMCLTSVINQLSLALAEPNSSFEFGVQESLDRWITKSSDYYHKHGFAYELSDKSFGVVFSDFTRLMLMPDKKTIHYIDGKNVEYHMLSTSYWDGLQAKMDVMQKFQFYFEEELRSVPSHIASFYSNTIQSCKPQLLY